MVHSLKIVLVSHDPGTQGAELAMLDMAILMRELGCEVTVIIPKGPGGLFERVRAHHFDVIRVRYKHWFGPGRVLGRLYRIALNLLFFPSMVIAIAGLRPDLVWTHSTAAPSAALASRVLGIKHIWHMHEFGPFGPGSYDVRYDLGERWSLQLMDLTQSHYVAVAEVIKSTFAGKLKRGRIDVIHQPVPVDTRPHKLDRHQLEHVAGLSGPLIVYVGAISQTKRQIELVEALPAVLRHHPGANVLLVGDCKSDYARDVKAAVQRLGVTAHVHLLGLMRNPSALVKRCDISVNCRLAEAAPRGVVESMMLGTPVVAADSGGNREMLRGDLGLLYEPGDSASLAAEMLSLLEDACQSHEVSMRAQQFAEKTRSMNSYSEIYAQRLVDLAESLALRTKPKV